MARRSAPGSGGRRSPEPTRAMETSGVTEPGRIAESVRVAVLGAGPVPYILRRTPRARGLRITIDPRRGLIVSVPTERRRGWSIGADARAEAFLLEREPWIRRHLDRLARERERLAAAGGARDGGTIRYRGEPHRIRVCPAPAGVRRSTVERSGDDGGDELVVRVAAAERRPLVAILEAWLRARAGEAVALAIARHADALGVAPARVDLRDPRTRWGSASRTGRLMLSWRLILAPPDSLETVVVHELAHLRLFGHGPRFWDVVASRRPDHLAHRAWLRRHAHELHAALEPAG